VLAPLTDGSNLDGIRRRPRRCLMSDDTNPSSPAQQGLLRSFIHRLGDDPMPLPVEGLLAPFDGAVAWLNS